MKLILWSFSHSHVLLFVQYLKYHLYISTRNIAYIYISLVLSQLLSSYEKSGLHSTHTVHSTQYTIHMPAPTGWPLNNEAWFYIRWIYGKQQQQLTCTAARGWEVQSLRRSFHRPTHHLLDVNVFLSNNQKRSTHPKKHCEYVREVLSFLCKYSRYINLQHFMDIR